MTEAERGQNVGERPRGAPDLHDNEKDVGEALLEAHEYGQQGFESPF